MCKITLKLEEIQKIHNKLKTTKDENIINILKNEKLICDRKDVSLKSFGVETSCERFYIEDVILFEPKMVYKDISASIKQLKGKIRLEILWVKGLGLDTLNSTEFEEFCPKIGSNLVWSKPKKVTVKLDNLVHKILNKSNQTGYIHIYSKNNIPIISIRNRNKWVEPEELNKEEYINSIIDSISNCFKNFQVKEIYWQDSGIGEYIVRRHSDNEVTISIY